MFIYLTPNGEIPSDSRWNILRYSDIRSITDAHLQYMENFPSNFDSKIIEFIRDYKDLLAYVIVSELNFQNRIQSFNSEEFIRTIFPGDMHYKLFKSEADQIIKVWEGFGKAYKKNKPLKYTPSLSSEAKRYLKRYSKSVALNLVDLRNKAQVNTIIPVKTEFEKTELERYKLRTEGFVLNFEHAEDDQTKAFIKLVEDTKNMILGEKENS